jgi:hypothetical protein
MTKSEADYGEPGSIIPPLPQGSMPIPAHRHTPACIAAVGLSQNRGKDHQSDAVSGGVACHGRRTLVGRRRV